MRGVEGVVADPVISFTAARGGTLPNGNVRLTQHVVHARFLAHHCFIRFWTTIFQVLPLHVLIPPMLSSTAHSGYR